jgi:hypothetical protein
VNRGKTMDENTQKTLDSYVEGQFDEGVLLRDVLMGSMSVAASKLKELQEREHNSYASFTSSNNTNSNMNTTSSSEPLDFEYNVLKKQIYDMLHSGSVKASTYGPMRGHTTGSMNQVQQQRPAPYADPRNMSKKEMLMREVGLSPAIIEQRLQTTSIDREYMIQQGLNAVSRIR